jgi:hypothetical protein
MKSDDVRTIFSVYEIWMSMEKERVAGRQERFARQKEISRKGAGSEAKIVTGQ